MTAKKSPGPETPAEIQKVELRRRRAKWNEAKSEEAADDKPFALESVPASSKHHRAVLAWAGLARGVR